MLTSDKNVIFMTLTVLLVTDGLVCVFKQLFIFWDFHKTVSEFTKKWC